MEKQTKFILPPPNFGKNPNEQNRPKLHYLTPSGMTLLPREKQPPPMNGTRGATFPAKYLQSYLSNEPAKPAAPAIERHFCEVCDIELQTGHDLRLHRSQHERCPVDGCNYCCHPSVMDKHVMSLHTNGIFEKCKKLNTPEEIAAWREERRRKYPTVANVQMKQLALQQRQKRGERLEQKQNRFGKREDRRCTTKENNGTANSAIATHENEIKIDRNKKRHERKKFNKKRKAYETPKATEKFCVQNEQIETNNEEEINCGGVYMFKGTSKMVDYKHVQNKNFELANALTNLLGMYGSDCSEDESEETNENESAIMLKEISKEPEPVVDEGNETIEEIATEMKEETKECLAETAKVITLLKKSKEDLVGELADNNSSDEAPIEAPIAHSCETNASSNSKPAEVPTCENEKLSGKRRKLDVTSVAVHPKKSRTRKSGLDYRKARLCKQNTMLQKLLEKDIRHERNVLLQCVRFVCENSFFDRLQSN